MYVSTTWNYLEYNRWANSDFSPYHQE